MLSCSLGNVEVVWWTGLVKTGWHPEESLPTVAYYSTKSKEVYRTDKCAIRIVFSWLQGLSLNLISGDRRSAIEFPSWGQVSPFTWASDDDWVINRALSILSCNTGKRGSVERCQEKDWWGSPPAYLAEGGINQLLEVSDREGGSRWVATLIYCGNENGRRTQCSHWLRFNKQPRLQYSMAQQDSSYSQTFLTPMKRWPWMKNRTN